MATKLITAALICIAESASAEICLHEDASIACNVVIGGGSLIEEIGLNYLGVRSSTRFGSQQSPMNVSDENEVVQSRPVANVSWYLEAQTDRGTWSESIGRGDEILLEKFTEAAPLSLHKAACGYNAGYGITPKGEFLFVNAGGVIVVSVNLELVTSDGRRLGTREIASATVDSCEGYN